MAVLSRRNFGSVQLLRVDSNPNGVIAPAGSLATLITNGATYRSADGAGAWQLVTQNSPLVPPALVSSFPGSGAQGAQGDRGAQGAQGVQGYKGQKGPQGAQGSSGAQGGGSVGSQGAQGPQGAQGSQGLAGSAGQTGNQGHQGASSRGAQGSQGAQGSTGASPQGAQGSTGPQGAQGATGQNSAQGAQGTQGTTGAQGSQGVQGSTGNGTQGSQGAQGSSGASGPAGTQGNQGAQGSLGMGAQGAQGAQGSQGTASVVSGAQGSSGSAASGLVLIQSQVVTGSPVQSITFSGLDGNTHKSYFLVYRIYISNAGGSQYPVVLRPNNLTSNQTCTLFYSAQNSTAQYSNGTMNGLTSGGGGCPNGGEAFGIVDIMADSSKPRYFNYTVSGWASAASVPFIYTGVQRWNESSTNLTSLVLYCQDLSAAAATAIGSGSAFHLYRYEV